MKNIITEIEDMECNDFDDNINDGFEKAREMGLNILKNKKCSVCKGTGFVGSESNKLDGHICFVCKGSGIDID